MRTASVSTSEDRSSTRFGKYSLIRRLAEGGMATLYLASADGPGGFSKPCVVKRIRAPFSKSQRFRDMLGKEARVAALLSHPNIVQVFDYGEVDDECYLAMEYVDGVGLDHVLRFLKRERTRLELPTVLALGLAISDALAYVHDGVLINGVRSSVVHRDVSPSNILISKTGTAKLTDFGIVKLLESSGATEAGVVKGKYGYMSPEQLMGREVDGQADVFALGVVLIELLIGRPLFERRDVAATITAVLGANVPRTNELNPDLPPEVDGVLRRAVARKREERYPSARAFHSDLLALASKLDMSWAVQELAALARGPRHGSTFTGTSVSGPPTDSLSSARSTPWSSFAPGFDEAGWSSPQDPDDGYGLVVWVALGTTAVVASIVFWVLTMAS